MQMQTTPLRHLSKRNNHSATLVGWSQSS